MIVTNEVLLSDRAHIHGLRLKFLIESLSLSRSIHFSA